MRLERSDDINPGSLKPGFCIHARSPRTHLDHPCLGRASLVGAKPLSDEWMTTGQCKTKPTNVRTAARELTADALEALAQVLRNGSSAWIAIVSIAVAAGFSLVGLIVQGLMVSFHFGRYSQRLSAVEDRTRDVEGNNAALAVLTATVGGIDKRLVEVALDVKNLLTGRVRPPARRDADS